jgi:hypothetical protein
MQHTDFEGDLRSRLSPPLDFEIGFGGDAKRFGMSTVIPCYTGFVKGKIRALQGVD